MKKQVLNLSKAVLLLLLAGSLFSCGDAAKKEKATEEQPKVEEAPVVENMVKNDGVEATKVVRVENMHQTRYIELFFAYEGTKEEGILAECYNTMFTPKGIPADKDTAPQDLVEKLNFVEMAKEYGVANVSLNGPKLWLPDWSEMEGGTVRDFGGLEACWIATLHMGDNMKGVKSTKPYDPQTISRKSSVGWNKGTKVVLLDDPNGTTWIMKGFQLGLTPQFSYDEYLSSAQTLYKTLPEGWKVRIITLKKDLIETPENGVATIMADEFFNVFDKTGPGMMNYKP